MANALIAVEAIANSGLQVLQRHDPFLMLSNKKFQNFSTTVAGVEGTTVRYQLPPKINVASNQGLGNVSFDAFSQRVQAIVCDQTEVAAYAFSSEDLALFSRATTRAAAIELADRMTGFGIADSAFSSIAQKMSFNLAQKYTESSYRFYGDGLTAINSQLQIAEAVNSMKDFGVGGGGEFKCVLPLTDSAPIVNSMLSQFVTRRNDDRAYDWELGKFNNTNFYNSAMIPIHYSGDTGTGGHIGTIQSVTSNIDPVTDEEFSVVTIFWATAPQNDANAVRPGDLFQVLDEPGIANARFLNTAGHTETNQPVQFASRGGHSTAAGVTTITTKNLLLHDATNASPFRNVNRDLVGLTVKGLPNHRRGLIWNNDALYMAMPKLGDLGPGAQTAVATDSMSGASIRCAYGTILAEQQVGYILSSLYGIGAARDYLTAVIFPV